MGTKWNNAQVVHLIKLDGHGHFQTLFISLLLRRNLYKDLGNYLVLKLRPVDFVFDYKAFFMSIASPREKAKIGCVCFLSHLIYFID